MRNLPLSLLIMLSEALSISSFAPAQTAPAAKAKGTAAFDPHDLSGVWYRVSPFQTFSNVDNRQPGASVEAEPPA